MYTLVGMDEYEVVQRQERSFYCDFSFGNADFSVFLDETFFSDIILQEKKANAPIPTHNHAHHEIIALTAGSMTSYGDTETATVKKQQCLYCPAKMMHTTKGETAGTRILSIGFTVKKNKANRKYNDYFSFVAQILGQNKRFVVFDSETLFDNIIKIKKYLDANNPLIQFRVQTVLQDIVLELCEKLYKLSKQINLPPFYGNNISYLINMKLNKHLHKINLKDIADELFISKRQLERYTQKLFGMSFIERRTFLRLETAKNMLTETDLPISEIIAKIGFTNNSAFYKKFHERVGCTPQSFRKLHGKMPAPNNDPNE